MRPRLWACGNDRGRPDYLRLAGSEVNAACKDLNAARTKAGLERLRPKLATLGLSRRGCLKRLAVTRRQARQILGMSGNGSRAGPAELYHVGGH